MPADRAHLALLQHAQQLHLERRRQLADLVEEQRAAVGRPEEAGLALVVGAGEGALLVAEQLALEQRLGQRAAVDGDERRAWRAARSSWSARATSSLPVPLSPVISTVERPLATRAHQVDHRLHASGSCRSGRRRWKLLVTLRTQRAVLVHDGALLEGLLDRASSSLFLNGFWM